MYHSFLIHSSANGHLGCFHVLAIVNSSTAVLRQRWGPTGGLGKVGRMGGCDNWAFESSVSPVEKSSCYDDGSSI